MLQLETSTILRATIYLPKEVFEANDRLNVDTAKRYHEYHRYAGQQTGEYTRSDPVKTKVFDIVERVTGNSHGNEIVYDFDSYISFDADNLEQVEQVKSKIIKYLSRLKEFKNSLTN